MMDISWLSRTEALVGREALEKLANSHVMVLGLGGVGSFAAEFIARSGVGKMTIIDGDTVDPSNRNRQLPALATNHGQPKAQIMKERLLAINPELELNVIQEFILPQNIPSLLDLKPDYCVEAIDSITPKLFFIRLALDAKIPFVSSMGAGGKVDPTKIKVADIGKTYNCKLAQHIRKKLKKHGIKKGVKSVFSTELPDKESLLYTDGSNFKKSAYGTMSYLPAAFGGTLASVVIRDLMG
ncbi:tRNA threonylcarbamoyladenosine dehydratase [Sphingobacterium endophyticum]|uniref:tRNA threonylcarbamoyladenosine dehydratase n=1 Tax=Sphingobacterium endophyticum TaxID=2546448 RepID=UPI0012E1D10D|nr:tRNA threonylcarbamoyladenosine dehydratase [Sphingobacterium endophyticum]